MSVLTQGNYLADWLIEEFGAPDYCREERVVLVDQDLASGMCLGVHTLTPALYPYDNSAPAAVTGILINSLEVADAKVVTSIVVLSNVGTVTTPVPHGLIVGDAVKVSGATVDLELNAIAAVATAPTATIYTIATANVSNATYTEATLRVTKVNQPAACLVRGPAVVSSAGLSWAAACGTTEKDAGIVDIKALSPAIIVREGV